MSAPTSTADRRKSEQLTIRVTRQLFNHERRMGRTPSRQLSEDRLRHLSADLVLAGTEGQVEIWRRHADELLRIHRIEATWGVVGNANGWALPRSREIECAPINGLSSYVTFLHEVGHVVRPRARTVDSELEAWRFAMSVARPTWTRLMHRELELALNSYRDQATPDEWRQIDKLCGFGVYADVRLKRLRET